MSETGSMAQGHRLKPVRHLITQEGVAAYAEASGDFNPIHLDADFAAGSHFGRRVAHGMMVAASISELMARAFGLEWARSGRMKIRFRAPVFPGDRIETRGMVEKIEDVGEGGRRVFCRITTVRATGDGEEIAITADASVVLTQ